MQSQKLSISLSAEMVSFIEQYRQTTGRTSHSQVVAEAIQLLQVRELEQAYREASMEEDDAWEATLEDGLSHETW
ncbi:MAG: CopG family transcriptional regulator [Microcystaceae cyanobacterium]